MPTEQASKITIDREEFSEEGPQEEMEVKAREIELNWGGHFTVHVHPTPVPGTVRVVVTHSCETTDTDEEEEV